MSRRYVFNKPACVNSICGVYVCVSALTITHTLAVAMTTSALRRQVKNIVHNYSDAEIKVREATSNDPWGPSSSLMSEIAELTFSVVAFSEVMAMVWKRLNDHGKNWRHVYKVCGAEHLTWAEAGEVIPQRQCGTFEEPLRKSGHKKK